ncbi:nucleotide cyclase [Chytridium lagenaria]|nr:nucleotide cyclase [Chytridium lagenaria]
MLSTSADKVNSIRAKATKVQDDAFDLQPLTFLYANLGVWATLTTINIYLCLFSDLKPKETSRAFSDDWYKVTAFTFVIACTFALIGFVGSNNRGKKNVIVGMLIIMFVVGLTWRLQAYRMTVTLVDHAGNPLDVSRYIEWVHSMPALSYLIGRMTREKPLVMWATVVSSYVISISGFFSALARHPYHELFSTVSMMVFLFLCRSFENMFQTAIDGETGSKVEPNVLKALKWITLGSWWGIAVAWYIQKSRFVSFAAGEALICLCEMTAKIVFMLVFVNNTIDQAQSEMVVVAENIAVRLEKEMNDSERLLSKLIPQSVLDQLKSGEAAETEEYSSATVFFSDIANFTIMSSKVSTQDMLATLRNMWVEYDAIAERYGMYKVETIGDAYLGIVGAPNRVSDHAERAANFSLDIITMIKGFRTVTGEAIKIRVGLSSGPVTGGIMGDLNPHCALKMEASSKPLMVHISEATYHLLMPGKKFTFLDGEPFTIKETSFKTYFVLARR